MSKFFHGWQRNIGVVVLVMALVFMGGLVRSLSIGDRVTFFTGELTGETIVSNNGYLKWASWKMSRNPSRHLPAPSSFIQWDRYPLCEGNSFSDEDESIECGFRCLFFGFGRASSGSLALAYAHRVWFVSYWAIVISTTLLSACLLLTSACSPISNNSTESVPADLLSRWRQKTGVVTLVLACVFMVGWVRSFYFADRLGVSEEINRISGDMVATKWRLLFFCESLNGSIRWISFKFPAPFAETDDEGEEDEKGNAEVELVEPTYHGWQVTSRREKPSHFVADDHPESGYRLGQRFMGFGGGDVESIDGAKSIPGTLRFIPYWSIVIPLTLLSANLLLTKPRQAKKRD